MNNNNMKLFYTVEIRHNNKIRRALALLGGILQLTAFAAFNYTFPVVYFLGPQWFLPLTILWYTTLFLLANRSIENLFIGVLGYELLTVASPAEMTVKPGKSQSLAKK